MILLCVRSRNSFHLINNHCCALVELLGRTQWFHHLVAWMCTQPYWNWPNTRAMGEDRWPHAGKEPHAILWCGLPGWILNSIFVKSGIVWWCLWWVWNSTLNIGRTWSTNLCEFMRCMSNVGFCKWQFRWWCKLCEDICCSWYGAFCGSILQQESGSLCWAGGCYQCNCLFFRYCQQVQSWVSSQWNFRNQLIFVFFCYNFSHKVQRTTDIFIQSCGKLGACLRGRFCMGWLVCTHLRFSPLRRGSRLQGSSNPHDTCSV